MSRVLEDLRPYVQRKWTEAEIHTANELAADGLSTLKIAIALDRTLCSVEGLFRRTRDRGQGRPPREYRTKGHPVGEGGDNANYWAMVAQRNRALQKAFFEGRKNAAHAISSSGPKETDTPPPRSNGGTAG